MILFGVLVSDVGFVGLDISARADSVPVASTMLERTLGDARAADVIIRKL